MTSPDLDSTPSSDREACPSCGARLGGRSGCQEVFEQLQAQAWSSPVRAAVHNLVVDTYAMQHPEEYCRSAKSYLAHLTGLCCGVEASGDPRLSRAISRWLDGSTALGRPADISQRGRLTIATVRAPGREEDYAELVRAWAKDVWAAYDAQHGAARQCLGEGSRYVDSAGSRLRR